MNNKDLDCSGVLARVKGAAGKTDHECSHAKLVGGHVYGVLLPIMMFWAGVGSAATEPQYISDPFGDADFKDTPHILSVKYPNKGRTEFSLMFAGSFVDKYSKHMGAMLDVNYHVFNRIAVGVTLGHLHGRLTPIVTDPQGVLGNKLAECGIDSTKCANLNPNVPDYKQITGVADMVVMWTPLYGKLNIFSELDTNVELYTLAGMGVNGTRQISASATADRRDFNLSGGGFFEGGMFSNPKFNGTFGGGVRLFAGRSFAVRAEVRTILFRDEFVFKKGQAAEGYTSAYWFGQVGVSYVLF
jgi:outer membrane beta-barrel protein